VLFPKSSATEDTETDALANFGRTLADRTGGGRCAFADWDEALDRLFSAVTGRLIVIDEFPYPSSAGRPLTVSASRATHRRP
jgi:uncharacterized protein